MKAGDLAGAAASAEAIRAYPKSEKILALRLVARGYHKAGNSDQYRSFLRQELAVCQAEKPKDAKLGPAQQLTSISVGTFIDPDLESMTGLEMHELETRPIIIRSLLEGPASALKQIEKMPADDPKLVQLGALTRKRQAYFSLVSTLVYNGDLAAAQSVLDAIADPDTRLAAMVQMAYALQSDVSN